MRVGVVGLGLMGASFAAALRLRRPDLELIGVDSDPAVVATALERGLISEPGTAGADLILVAVPPQAVKSVLKRLPRDILVTDVTSTKVSVCAWAEEAGLDFVGGHPMCGREAAGLDAAEPGLFEGAPWVLTRRSSVIEDLVAAVGAHPVLLSPERHDQLVAGVSHAAFAVSVAYLLALTAAADWPEMAPLASSGFRDLTRLAAGSPEMYTGIAASNGPNLAGRLRAVEDQLARLRRHVEAGDPRLVELFEEAREARRRWLAERG